MELGQSEIILLAGMTALLAVICVFYNKFVEAINGKDDAMGYVAFEVIAGVTLVLLAAIPVIGLIAVLKLFALFAGAGLPMTAGYIDRKRKQHEHDREAMKKLAEGALDDATQNWQE